MKLKLKDPSTTFHDPETRLSVAGDEEVELDTKARKGKLTLAAIKAGGLVEVKTSADKKGTAKDSKDADKK